MSTGTEKREAMKIRDAYIKTLKMTEYDLGEKSLMLLFNGLFTVMVNLSVKYLDERVQGEGSAPVEDLSLKRAEELLTDEGGLHVSRFMSYAKDFLGWYLEQDMPTDDEMGDNYSMWCSPAYVTGKWNEYVMNVFGSELSDTNK